MSNVIKLRRTNEDLKDRAIQQIQEDRGDYSLLITFPKDFEEDNNKVMFYSNFEAGSRELEAVQIVLDYMMHNLYVVEEE